MSKTITNKCLKEISAFLKTESKKKIIDKYYVPSLWIDPNSRKNIEENINPFKFYSKRIDEILEIDVPVKNTKYDLQGKWSNSAIVYNIFVRLTTAYDHSKNGNLDLPVNQDGWRETGTFLKTIALLPYIKKLGANTLHFLPITSIGQDGNKGNLGSPYAIKNPYKIDENLSEPILGFDVDFQFKAMIEAAKRMGFRIILEFVFRTSSKDGDWIPEHPEWFYWIKNDIELRHPSEMDETKYGSPIFPKDQLFEIHRLVKENKLDSLIEPSPIYQNMFTKPPVKVEYIDGRHIGTMEDNTKVKIPGAFADWPPDDNQPPWSDVTYLRMYNHSSFNYIAYNTIRMYDSRLAQYAHRNAPLWEKIINIIPHYQNDFEIDGVMIDMGHALPPELLKEIQRKAREINPYFAFWEENFSLTHKSVQQGYNITLGYLWCDEYNRDKLKAILNVCATTGFPLPFFSTSESHNTPRSIARKGGILYSKYSFAINCFLPAIVFIHSGYELGVDYPVNTGLDFTNDEIEKLPSEKLPLFSESSYDWNSENQIIDFIKQIIKIRKKYEEIIVSREPATFGVLNFPNENIIGFYRKSLETKKIVFVIANSNFDNEEYARYNLLNHNGTLNDWIENEKIHLQEGEYKSVLMPGEVKILGN